MLWLYCFLWLVLFGLQLLCCWVDLGCLMLALCCVWWGCRFDCFGFVWLLLCWLLLCFVRCDFRVRFDSGVLDFVLLLDLGMFWFRFRLIVYGLVCWDVLWWFGLGCLFVGWAGWDFAGALWLVCWCLGV